MLGAYRDALAWCFMRLRLLSVPLLVMLAAGCRDAPQRQPDPPTTLEQGLRDAALFQLFKERADRGDPGAQEIIGDLYDSGRGVDRNPNEAAKWYRLAAEGNNFHAQAMLGAKYANGDGVPQDFVLAHMWLNLSASRLPPPPLPCKETDATMLRVCEDATAMGRRFRETVLHNRNAVELRLTKEQLGEAQRQSWLGETGHRDKWNFCLTAAKMAGEQEGS
jgi:hypothetical protein